VEAITLRLKIDACDPLTLATGDAYSGYLVARNYHGRGAAAASLFLERKISGSLLTSLAEASGFRIVHRGDVRNKYKLAFRRWDDLHGFIVNLANKLRNLKDVPMSLVEAEQFIDALLKIQPGEEYSTQKRNLRAALLDAFNMPRFGTYGSTSADMYHGVTRVGSYYTASKSKLTHDDIMVGLLEGTRGERERRALVLLDRFVAKKLGR
jgi:hypothetical protein